MDRNWEDYWSAEFEGKSNPRYFDCVPSTSTLVFEVSVLYAHTGNVALAFPVAGPSPTYETFFRRLLRSYRLLAIYLTFMVPHPQFLFPFAPEGLNCHLNIVPLSCTSHPPSSAFRPFPRPGSLPSPSPAPEYVRQVIVSRWMIYRPYMCNLSTSR